MGSVFKRFDGAGVFLRALLLGSATVGVAPALAQSPQAEAAAATEAVAADELVVIGRRPLAESEAASLAAQRLSPNLVSVLSADAIGQLPDQNIAFAIGRLPGISLERDQGQARYVNLRGAPRQWTTLSFDGLSVVSPEGRQTRFDNIPSALSKQVVVNKAITADLPADTVAGNVDIITRSARDYKGATVRGKAAIGYVTLGGGEEFDGSIVLSNRFFDDKLGVLISGSRYLRNMVTDNWETDPYLANPTGANQGVRFAREYENKPYRLTRENDSLSARIDYEIAPDQEVFFSAIFTEYRDEELRNNYIFRLDQGTLAPGSTHQVGTVLGARIDMNTNSLESREESYINTFGGEHALAGWDLSWRLNYTYTVDGGDAPALPTFQSPSDPALRPTVQYDFSDRENNTVRLFRTVVTGTGSSAVRSQGALVRSIDDFSIPFTGISKRIASEETGAYTTKFDAERDLDLLGANLRVKTGAIWSDRTKKAKSIVWSANAARFTALGLALPTYDLFRNGKPYQGELALGYDFDYHSKDALDRYMAQLIQSGVAQRQDTSGDTWKVTERILGVYGMGTLELDWGNIVFGVRAERIENEGRARSTLGDITVTNEETLYYPSVHVNYDLNEDMKLRFGLTSTASRPDFNQIRPNLTINDTARTISGGNPFAVPEKQIGADVYFEWYMQPEGFFSAGVFYKDITDVLFTQSGTFDSDILGNSPTGLPRSEYTFTTTRNAREGWLSGLEISYSQTAEDVVERAKLPDWLGGFGLRATATWVDSEVTVPTVAQNSTVAALNKRIERTVRLPGSSEQTYNLQLIYEKYDLSVRLAYQYRTEWVQSIAQYRFAADDRVYPDGNGDIYWDNDDELDLSIRYQVNDNLEWFFDGVNLLDGAGIRFADNPAYPIEFEKFGERYIMGLRFTFGS